MMRKYVGALLRVARELCDIISSVRKLRRYSAENAVLLNKGHSTNIVEAGRVGVWTAPSKGLEGIRGD